MREGRGEKAFLRYEVCIVQLIACYNRSLHIHGSEKIFKKRPQTTCNATASSFDFEHYHLRTRTPANGGCIKGIEEKDRK